MAAGKGLEGSGPGQMGSDLFKSGPGTMAPREVEGLTMVTPLPACVHRVRGTLGWVLPDAVLMGPTRGEGLGLGALWYLNIQR
jgi:hypothetical protein